VAYDVPYALFHSAADALTPALSRPRNRERGFAYRL